MAIVVNLDVIMAKRKISAGDLAEKIGITPANLSILKNNKAKAIRFSRWKRSAECWIANRGTFWSLKERIDWNMNGELSGGTNGMVYERVNMPQTAANSNTGKLLPMNFSAADIAFAFVMLLCGFLYWNLIQIVSLGLGVTLFAAVLCTATAVYFKSAGLRQSKESLAFLGVIILSAANFTLFDGILIKALNFIFLSLGFVYWVCLSAGTRLENKISLYILSDMLRQLFVIPFSNFTGCFSGAKQVFVKNKKGKGVLSGIIGIVFFLPVLILVITLLISADAAFESLMERLRFSFRKTFWSISGISFWDYLQPAIFMA